MRKIILGLFIILFCFSIGIAELQEEEPLKGEKLKSELYKKEELYFKTLNRDALEKFSKEELISEILALKELHRLIREEAKSLDELVKMHEEDWKHIRELIKEISKPEEKDNLSWLDKYPDLTKKEEEFSWLDKWEEEDRLERIEKENDRLEDLLEQLKNERSALEWDMMRYRWDLENAKLDPLDYQVALDSAIASAMIAPSPLYDLWFYPYYPSYSIKADRTNYEPLLFTLCTDSKGKIDWTKYGWLKLLLKNK